MLRSYLFYFGQKDPIKVPILTLSSALVKICQISVFFQTTGQSFFKICITPQCHERKLCTFVAQTIYTLVSRSQLKHKFLDFWVLESKFVKFLMSVLKQKVRSSSIFVSFFILMTHNFSVNFKLMHFLLWTKGSHQSSNFDTF